MDYGIVLTLDYQAGNPVSVKKIFNNFRHRLESQGFLMDGRLFTIAAGRDEAVSKGRKVLAALEEEYRLEGEDIYLYIREYYCVKLSCITNLLVPDSGSMDVTEIDSISEMEEIVNATRNIDD